MNKYTLLKYITIFLPIGFSLPALADCYKITVTNNNPASVYYTEPGKGTVASWGGALDGNGSMGTIPKIVNINNNAFQPLGTLIASGTTSFLDSGTSKYTPDQILFRCTPDEAGKLREFYSTNGDSAYAGMYQVNSALGLDETYTTIVSGLGLRVKNMATGQYYSRYWKSRPLNNLDVDSKGWILVKAKDFSNASIELYKIDYNANNLGNPRNTYTGLVAWTQPAAYIALKSSNIGINFDDGVDHYGHHHGWYAEWPASMVNLHNNLIIRRAATCFVQNVTPNVLFPTLSVSDLNNGTKATMPININFQCQSGSPANSGVTALFSGTHDGQTAFGLLPKPANVASAQNQGLTVGTGAAVTHLLSDGYGSAQNVATGVGISFTRKNGTQLNLLSTLASSGQGASYGWYPVLDDAISSGNINGVTSYSKTLDATFGKLPGKVVTAGKYNATVQVIIQVQ